MSLKLLLNRFVLNQRSLLLITRRGYSPSWGPPKQIIDRKDIEFRVIKTLSLHDKIDSNSLKLSSHLISDLGLDSLDRIELIVGIEDEFQLEKEIDENFDQLLTVESIVDYLIDFYEKKVDQNQRPDIEFKEGMMNTPND